SMACLAKRSRGATLRRFAQRGQPHELQDTRPAAVLRGRGLQRSQNALVQWERCLFGRASGGASPSCEPYEGAIALPMVKEQASVVKLERTEVFSVYVPGESGTALTALLEKNFGKAITTRTW